ncbi:hypothetical protein [Naasia sp. SYSU D00057]|uniref:hypothetical protein n=1 Tax=Naasia sp. SYSU D00057 TaxID=2817380 RepID=UPI001B311BD2|nr:hypothetical protein [Naasia sp. SYSU D00057]
MPDDETLMELGRMAVAAAELESLLRTLVYELVSDSPEVSATAIGNPGFARMLELVEPLARAQGLPAAAVELLLSAVSGSAEAMRGRNEILHSRWASENVQVRGRGIGFHMEVSAENVRVALLRVQNACRLVRHCWEEVVLALGRAEAGEGGFSFPDRWGSQVVRPARPDPHVAPVAYARANFTGEGISIVTGGHRRTAEEQGVDAD